MKTLIVGIGNLLRADDGVGIHVIDALRKEDIGDKADLTEDITGLPQAKYSNNLLELFPLAQLYCVCE